MQQDMELIPSACVFNRRENVFEMHRNERAQYLAWSEISLEITTDTLPMLFGGGLEGWA